MDKDLIKKITNFINKYEIVLILLVIGLVLLKWLAVPFINLFVIVGILSVSSLYFLSSHEIVEKLTAYQRMVVKTSGMGSAITLIGILFSTLKWPNSKMMLTVGVLTLTVSLVGIYLTKLNKTDYFSQDKMLRIYILIALGGYFVTFASNVN